MYSGTTLNNFSGNIFGAHQKIDRVARKALQAVTNDKHFPNSRLILHFEGRNGPDGIKSKSPAQDEPWHYYDPFDPYDTDLISLIKKHYQNLVEELKENDLEKAAFEAAWLSHAIVDGLTPAHHYPYEEELVKMRGGEGIETRTSFKEKVVMKGDNTVEVVKNNWKMWGLKGVMTTHGFFEFGVAAIMAPLKFKDAYINKDDINHAKEIGIDKVFMQSARKIALMNLYDDFGKYGWTLSLSRKVRDNLIPEIIKVVSLAWYLALNEAGKTGR